MAANVHAQPRFLITPLYAPPPGRRGHTRSVPLQQTVFSSLFSSLTEPSDAPRCACRCHKSSGAFNTERFAITND